MTGRFKLPSLPTLKAKSDSQADVRAVEDLDRARRVEREDTGYVVCVVFANRRTREKWLREHGHVPTGEPVEFVTGAI